MLRQPPRLTRTDTLLPYTTLFRSPYAIDQGLVAATGATSEVRIFNVNTGKRIVASVPTRDGLTVYQGDARIDGVPGQAAPIWLRFEDMAGAKTGKLLPTGNLVDHIGGLEVRCVDAAVPMAIVAAGAGTEERRVGKERVSSCGSRGARVH